MSALSNAGALAVDTGVIEDQVVITGVFGLAANGVAQTMLPAVPGKRVAVQTAYAYLTNGSSRATGTLATGNGTIPLLASAGGFHTTYSASGRGLYGALNTALTFTPTGIVGADTLVVFVRLTLLPPTPNSQQG